MKNLIAIDCGGTNLRVALIDEKLNLISVRRCSSIKDNPDLLYETMRSMIKDIMAEQELVSIDSIGMSVCGVVENNHVRKCGNLGITDYDFEKRFRDDFDGPAFMAANDANCSALVESLFGATKGLNNSIFVTISTGIGLGVIANGQMIDLPLEDGRLLINYKGNVYETEYLLSGNGLANLCRLNSVNIDSAKNFFDSVRNNDPKILPIFDEWLDLLALHFANLQLLFNAECYALSGGVMKSKELFIKKLEEKANKYIETWDFRKIILKDAMFSQDVGIKAAGALAIIALNNK